MTYEEMLSFCVSLPGACRDSPWEGHVVAKVGDKIFAYLDPETPAVTLKGEPVENDFLRQIYPAIKPPEAYLRKDLYNVVPVGGLVPDDHLRDMIRKSYDLVFAKLTRRQKEAVIKNGEAL